MFKMWWKIAKLAGLFFLGFGAAQDIKYQKISFLLLRENMKLLRHICIIENQRIDN